MTTVGVPFFLENEKWYTTPEDEGLEQDFFDDGRGYHIKDDAPDKAKQSYAEFYSAVEYEFTPELETVQ